MPLALAIVVAGADGNISQILLEQEVEDLIIANLEASWLWRGKTVKAVRQAFAAVEQELRVKTTALT